VVLLGVGFFFGLLPFWKIFSKGDGHDAEAETAKLRPNREFRCFGDLCRTDR
jgi:hypothetical protein